MKTEPSMIKVLYKCTDGSEFDTPQAADEHQKVVNVFDDILGKYGRYGVIEINSLHHFLDILQFVKDKGLKIN